MAKAGIPFEDFMAMVQPETVPAVTRLDRLMREGSCEVEIKAAKSGYVVSYRHMGTNRVMANFVFRKKGLLIRIYADNILRYMDALEELPAAMRDKVEKAPVCRRLINPELCSPNCPKGYEFLLAGQPYQKCRYSCFFFFLGEEADPHIEALLQKELACRAKAAG